VTVRAGAGYVLDMDGKRAKLDEVARLAGVSRSAASRAMNDQPGTTDLVRQRVRGAAAQLGFRPHAAARALAARSDEAGRDLIEILVVDPDPDALSSKPYYGRVLAGATRAIDGRDIALRLRQIPRPPADLGPAPFGRVLINVPAAAAVDMHRARTVSLGRSGLGVPYVAPDNEDGARQAAEHLLATGRRRLAAVFGPDTPCAQERKTGFLSVARAAGLQVLFIDGDFTRPTAYQATCRLLHQCADIDAVFAACDVTAIGVLQALRDAGRRVPHDVAVVGFDGSSLAEAADLSSVYLPVEQEADLAVRRLIDPGLPPVGRLPAALAVRGSS
jgi:DNA-binding LacI/PurR family transcriptional regulator